MRFREQSHSQLLLQKVLLQTKVENSRVSYL